MLVPWGPVSPHLGQPRAGDSNALGQLCLTGVFHGAGTACQPHGHPIPFAAQCPSQVPFAVHSFMLPSDPALPRLSQMRGLLVVIPLSKGGQVPGAGICSLGLGGAWKTAQFQSPVPDRGGQSSPSHRPVPSRQPLPLPSAAVLTSEQMSRGSGNERCT